MFGFPFRADIEGKAGWGEFSLLFRFSTEVSPCEGIIIGSSVCDIATIIPGKGMISPCSTLHLYTLPSFFAIEGEDSDHVLFISLFLFFFLPDRAAVVDLRLRGFTLEIIGTNPFSTSRPPIAE